MSSLNDWWGQFDDATLLLLVRAAEADSPSLASASARIDQARATLRSARASAKPDVSAQASAVRSGQQGSASQLTRSGTLDASWELDIFGGVRRNTEAAHARLDARTDDWHDARLSLAAEVADSYVQYRGCVMLVQSYEQELASMSQTVRATESLVRAGLSPQADRALAHASRSGTAASLLAQREECELLVKSLVHLTGLSETATREQLGEKSAALPTPAAFDVVAVPVQVIRQRADVASLEREIAAASAEVGVAEADLYPKLSLSGSLSVSSLTSWSFGPSLSLPIFDGGSRRAAVDSARAALKSSYASWQAGVRDAVKEVEQALVRLDSSKQRVQEAQRAATEYRRYFNAVESEWRAGTNSLLTLEEARRQALSAEITLVGLQRDRVRNWIALYKSVGGGWQQDVAASAPVAEVAP